MSILAGVLGVPLGEWRQGTVVGQDGLGLGWAPRKDNSEDEQYLSLNGR